MKLTKELSLVNNVELDLRFGVILTMLELFYYVCDKFIRIKFQLSSWERFFQLLLRTIKVVYEFFSIPYQESD